jgi:hypothetical protein
MMISDQIGLEPAAWIVRRSNSVVACVLFAGRRAGDLSFQHGLHASIGYFRIEDHPHSVLSRPIIQYTRVMSPVQDNNNISSMVLATARIFVLGLRLVAPLLNIYLSEPAVPRIQRSETLAISAEVQ